MKTINIRIEIPDVLSKEEEAILSNKAKEGAILALYETNNISVRQAAKALGLTLYDFLDLLGKKGIPIIRGEVNPQTIEEVLRKRQPQGKETR